MPAAPLAPPTVLTGTPLSTGTEIMLTWNVRNMSNISNNRLCLQTIVYIVCWELSGFSSPHQPPAPCTMFGGPLTDYTVRFSSDLEHLIGSNTTRLLLSSLHPSTSYHIMVAAHTSAGRGPFSSPINVTTTPGEGRGRQGKRESGREGGGEEGRGGGREEGRKRRREG